MMRIEKLLEAIRCCKQGLCEACPMQVETCDELRVDTIELPEELVDRIEEALEAKGNK